MPDFEELFTTVGKDTQPRLWPRASVSAYLIVAPVQIAEEPQPAGCRSESLVLPSFRAARAAKTAYDSSRNVLALPDVFPPQGVYVTFLAAPEPAPRRAGAQEYWVPARASFLADEPHTQAVVWPTRAPIKPAAAPTAYEIAASFVIGDARPLGSEMLPDVARPAKRAGLDAYSRVATFSPESLPPDARHLPDSGRTASTASRSAYVVAASFAPASEPPATIGVSLPAAARPPAAAAWSAYVIASAFVPQSEPPLVFINWPPPIPAHRAGFAAYSIASREFVEELAPERGRGFLDVRPRPLLRSGVPAYWIAQHSGIFEGVYGAFSGPFYPEQMEFFIAGAEVAEPFVPGNEAADKIL